MTSAAAGSPRDFDVISGRVTLPVHAIGGSEPDAATLIALHGGPGIVGDYLRVLEPLASASLRVVVYDQRGSPRIDSQLFQNGPPDAAEYAPARFAADLLAVMDALGVRRAHLLGHSWGGMTVHAFARDHPDRIASVILVDAIPPTWTTMQRGGNARQQRVKQLQTEGVLPPRLPAPEQDCREFIRAMCLAMIPDPRRPPPELTAFLNIGCSGQSGAPTFAQANGYDYRVALSVLDVPVLLMMGAADPLEVGWSDETEQALSHAKVRRVMLANSGHFPFWEQPEAFFAALRAFLRSAGVKVAR